MDGKVGFAEIFLENVRVPAAQRLGEDGQGWNVCMATAGFERGLMLRSPARYQMAVRKLLALYRRHASEVDSSVEAAVMRAWMDAESYALSIYATASRLRAGGSIGPESSTNKLFWSELDVALTQTALSILGARAELLPDAPHAFDAGTWLDDYVFALAGPIYGGTNEIQRNIVAERMLGLPR
jgi:alkylation response protein AidB-like acyl-CoA dehydrogenase